MIREFGILQSRLNIHFDANYAILANLRNKNVNVAKGKRCRRGGC